MQQPNGPDPLVIVASRFTVTDAREFAERSREALAVLATSDGFVSGRVGASTDDPGLRIIETTWSSIGAYRRALSRYEVKLSAIPLLSLAIDEPSAYEVVHVRDEAGARDYTAALAMDAQEIGLGSASGPNIPPVHG